MSLGNRLKVLNETVIFNVRWVLNLFYFGLIVVLGLYTYVYSLQIAELFSVIFHGSINTEQMKLLVLDTVDVVMIANLVKMIITGSYNSFVSKGHGYENENISSGTLKIKIATSVVVVAMIHLLKSFIGEAVDWNVIDKQLALFGAFLVAAIVLGVLDYLHVKSEAIEHEHDKNHH